MNKNFSKNKCSAIILAGGNSSRMGRNKALLKINERAIIEIIISTLQKFTNEIIISSNDNDFEYLGYPIVNDSKVDAGPIAGIHAGLVAAKKRCSIIISCDTPFVSPLVFEAMYSYISEYDIAVPSHSQWIEPLIGMYSKNVIPILDEMLINSNYSPMQLIRKVNSIILPMDENSLLPTNWFYNINTPEDFDKATEVCNDTIIE